MNIDGAKIPPSAPLSKLEIEVVAFRNTSRNVSSRNTHGFANREAIGLPAYKVSGSDSRRLMK